jgi:hypothetical protein
MGLIALLLMFLILPTDFKDGTVLTPRVTGLTADGKIDSAIAGDNLVLIYFICIRRLIVSSLPTSLHLWSAKASVLLGFCRGILTKKKVLDFRIENKSTFEYKNAII